YYDRFDQKEGWIAESWEWSVDSANEEGTVVYQIRQGINFALNPDSEASVLVGGRAMTMDDVLFSLKQMITDDRAYIYRANPELRGADIVQTGDWEISITLPLKDLYVGLGRFGNYGRVVPPEVVEEYGDMANWKNSVGTGPFMVTDFMPASEATLVRNPNYWGKDPVGPGKGNQLPYIDGYKYLIIPDSSTRLAAIRTGKLDQIVSLSWEDASALKSQVPDLKELKVIGGNLPSISMAGNQQPYSDVRVRRALMMATDFEQINETMQNGQGQILSWPYAYSETYADLYLGLDDPDIPASIAELYVYSPEKAKQLLADAGYPNGFQTTAIITAVEADYYSVIKDMWAKVGVEVELDVRERGGWAGVFRAKKQEAIGYYPQGPTSMWYTGISIMGPGAVNASFIDDPVINETMADIRIALVTEGEAVGLKMYREMLKHVLDQAYTIPGVTGISSHFWWPWIKNYSGEYSVGFAFLNNWVKWVWVDQDLKKEMGY
ncbi:MAG: ABC transporter substrate-binding protein, partial [Dehalococcoidales bacterium]